AAEQAVDITVKPAEPIRNSRRRPNMSPRRAPVIRNTARAGVWPGGSHWGVEALPPSARRIDGPATLTIVASIRSMMLAEITTANTNQRSGLRAVEGMAGSELVAMPSVWAIVRSSAVVPIYRSLLSTSFAVDVDD